MAYGQLTPLPLVVNGINYSWGNIAIAMFKVPITQITEITYKVKQEMVNNYGQGNQPVSRGFGKVEYEASIEIYQDLWQQIKRSAPNGDPFQFDPFDITMVLGGTRVSPLKVTLQFCQFLEDGFEAKTGDTSLMVKIPLIIAGIKAL